MPTSPESVLKAARAAFPTFYAKASADDALMMDGLNLSRAALLIGINTPRPPVADPIRDDLERTTDAVEEAFVVFRDGVRRCRAFRQLGRREQEEIEHAMFQFPSVARD